MNTLFICSANKRRSRTAEDHFCTLYPDHNFDSAGTNLKICSKEGTNPLTEELLEWADIIFAMEKKHTQACHQMMGKTGSKRVITLHIKDVFRYNDKKLIEILEKKIVQHLS